MGDRRAVCVIGAGVEGWGWLSNCRSHVFTGAPVVLAEDRHELATVVAVLRTDACQDEVADPLVLVYI
jgi:hypothetical protein